MHGHLHDFYFENNYYIFLFCSVAGDYVMFSRIVGPKKPGRS